MAFEDVWKQVNGLPETAKLQVPGVLSAATKKKLSRRMPEDVSEIVLAAIEEVNHGSVESLDTLIRKRL